MDGDTQTYSDPERDEVLRSTGSNNAMPDTEPNADRTEMSIPLERLYIFLTQYLPEEVHSLAGELIVDVVLQSNREPIRRGALPVSFRPTPEGMPGWNARYVLKKLADSPSKEITFASVASDAFELLSSSLAGQRDRNFAILKQSWDRLVLTTTNYMPALLPKTDTAFFRTLQAVHTTLKIHWQARYLMATLLPKTYHTSLHKILSLSAILQTHWQASHHTDSIQTAHYPFLSYSMSAGYYFALALWLGDLTSSLYRWCVADFYFEGSVSVVALGALCWSLHNIAVPYALGRGNRLATLAVLVFWVALGMAAEVVA